MEEGDERDREGERVEEKRRGRNMRQILMKRTSATALDDKKSE
jgi:hypothetical protein